MYDSLILAVKVIARKAGKTILDVYEQQDLAISKKADSTPVTAADLRANAVIVHGLQQLNTDYPILTEESEHADYEERKTWDRYWLVDPLDGTQEFINQNGQFTVNIALMERAGNGLCYPLFGVVHVPVINTSYWGGHLLGAFKQVANFPITTIKPSPLNVESVVVLGSRSYGTFRAATFLGLLEKTYPNIDFRQVGSSLKSCQVAEGTADIYPRLGPTSEWDTAAVQGVVEGAGGLLLNPEGERFSYNFKAHLLNSDFLVIGDTSINWKTFWNKAILDNLSKDSINETGLGDS